MRYVIISLGALLTVFGSMQPGTAQRGVRLVRPRVTAPATVHAPRVYDRPGYRYDVGQGRRPRTELEVPDTVENGLTRRFSGARGQNTPYLRHDQFFSVAKELNLRTGPSLRHPIVRVLQPGATVILGNRTHSEWAPVLDYQGQRIGYVYTAGDHLGGAGRLASTAAPAARVATREELARVRRRNSGAVGP